MVSTGRLFNCARCLKQTFICSLCDRGQRYCSPDCSKMARALSQRSARHRYQQSRNGRLKHALRMHAYRHRKQIVTHQGSWLPGSDGLLQATPEEPKKSTAMPRQPMFATMYQCHFCGRQCPELVRLDFLQRRRVRPINPFDRRGQKNDYSP